MIHAKENRKKLPSMKHVIPRILVLVVIGSLVGGYYYFNDSSSFRGEVEATILPTISEVSGRILESPISLGQEIKEGDVIARIDDSNQRYALEQLELSLEKRLLALSESSLASGGQASNMYLAAKAAYDSSVITANKAKSDYEDLKILFTEGAISSAEVDKARIASAQASSQVTAALAQLNNSLSQSGENSSQIDVSLLESQIRQSKDTLEKFTLKAPCDGIIISKNYSQGSMVAPGFNVADIGSFAEMYVVFYVPEDVVGNMQYDQKVTVGSGDDQWEAIVKYIDVKTQYTPKEQQTEANKSKTSFKVRALLPEKSDLHPGMKLTVTL